MATSQPPANIATPTTSLHSKLSKPVDMPPYSIVRSSRRKTLSIIIRPDSRIDVLVPKHISTARIHQFVHDKQHWIHKKRQQQQAIIQAHPAKTFTQGEKFKLLGETYPLSLCHTVSQPQLCNNSIMVAKQAPEKIKQQLIIWYQQQAEQYIQQRSQYFSTIVGKTPASIGIKSYTSRWGSCHHDGRIYFNWRLIMAPADIIDYVIVHELCHLIQHNHSPRFWQEVGRTLPDYRKAKDWLKSHGMTLDLD